LARQAGDEIVVGMGIGVVVGDVGFRIELIPGEVSVARWL
jgi:hypothetical protein